MEHVPIFSNDADYMDPDYGRTHNEIFVDHLLLGPFPHPQLVSHPYMYSPTNFPTHSLGMQGAIQIEIEKERIRKETIMSEIARRRVLEAEVRGELMVDVERDMAVRGGINGFPFTSSPGMGLGSPMKLSVLGMRSEGGSAQDRQSMEKRHESGGVHIIPFQRKTTDLCVSEVKPVMEGSIEKEGRILLAELDDSKIDFKIAEASSEGDDVHTMQEPPNSDGLHWKRLEVKKLQKKDDYKKNEIKIGEASSKREDLQPLQDIEYSNDMERKASEVQKVQSNNDSVKIELRILEASSKIDDLQPFPRIQNNQSEVQKVLTNNHSQKKRFYHWCEICQVGISGPQVIDSHKMGKKHARCLKLLGKSDEVGGVVSCTEKEKTAILSHHLDGVAKVGRTVMSDDADQTLEQTVIEGLVPMDDGVELHHEPGIPVGETQAEACGVVDAAKPDPDANNDKVESNGEKLTEQRLQETRNSDKFERKQLLFLEEVRKNDDPKKNEIKIREASSERQGLQPRKETEDTDDMEWKLPEVQKKRENNDSEKIELKTGESSAKRDDLPPLPGNLNPGNFKKQPSEVRKMHKSDDLTKKGSYFLCEICQMKIDHPYQVDSHFMGKKHARNVKPLGTSDQTGGVANLSHHADGVAEDEKNVLLDNAHQTLEQPRVEGLRPLDRFAPQKNELGISMGKSQSEDCGVLDTAKTLHDLNDDKVPPNGQELILQPMRETQCSYYLKRKQSEGHEVQKNDDSKMNELKIMKVWSKKENLKPVQGTPKSENFGKKQSEVQTVPKKNVFKTKEPKVVEASSKMEDVQPLQEIPKTDNLETKQSEVQTVQKNVAHTKDLESKKAELDDSKMDFKIAEASSKGDDVHTMQEPPNSDDLHWRRSEVKKMQKKDDYKKNEIEIREASSKSEIENSNDMERKESEVRKVQSNNDSVKIELKTAEASSKGHGLQPFPPSQNKQLEIQKMQTNDHSKKKRFYYWCEICQVGITGPQLIDSHKMGKKHARRLRLLGKSDEIGRVAPCTESEETAILSHHLDRVAKVGRTVTSDDARQTLEQTMLKGLLPMDDGVKLQPVIPVGETQVEACGVDAAKPEPYANNDKVKSNVEEPTKQTLRETRNSGKFEKKQLLVLEEVKKDDDSITNEIKVRRASSEREGLQPFKETEDTDDLEWKQAKVQTNRANNDSEKIELRTGESSSKRDDLQPLPGNLNPDNFKKKESEVPKVHKSDDLKKGFCQMVMGHPKHVDGHLMGRKHVRNVKLLGTSDQIGGVVNFSHHADRVAKDVETVVLDNSHQTLEQPRVKGLQPMIEVEPQQNELTISMGKSQSEDCGVLDTAKTLHDLNNDKVLLNGQEPILQTMQETQCSYYLKRKPSVGHKVQKNDDSKMNELKIMKVWSKKEDLKPLQGTPKSDNLGKKQYEVPAVQKKNGCKMKELKVVEASSKREDLQPLQEIPKSDNLETKQSEVQTVQKNDAYTKKESKNGKAILKGEDRRKLFTWKQKSPPEVETMPNTDASMKKNFDAGETCSMGDDPRPSQERRYLSTWRRK